MCEVHKIKIQLTVSPTKGIQKWFDSFIIHALFKRQFPGLTVAGSGLPHSRRPQLTRCVFSICPSPREPWNEPLFWRRREPRGGRGQATFFSDTLHNLFLPCRSELSRKSRFQKRQDEKQAKGRVLWLSKHLGGSRGRLCFYRLSRITSDSPQGAPRESDSLLSWTLKLWRADDSNGPSLCPSLFFRPAGVGRTR